MVTIEAGMQEAVVVKHKGSITVARGDSQKLLYLINLPRTSITQ